MKENECFLQLTRNTTIPKASLGMKENEGFLQLLLVSPHRISGSKFLTPQSRIGNLW